MTVREPIAELRALSEQGLGDARVLVRSEPFQLADMDADGEVRTFDAVPVLGVDFWGLYGRRSARRRAERAVKAACGS